MYLNLHILHFTLSRELSEIYANIAMRTFAISMIAVFIPLYFLNLGFDLGTVFIFYAIMTGMMGVTAPFAAYLVSKIGSKHTILLSIPFLILFYFSLHYLSVYSIPLWAMALLFGFAESLFWLGFHADFTSSTDRRHRSEEVSFIYTLPLLLAIAGPIIGAFVITFYSFGLLFIVASLILLASAFPLFLSGEIKKPYNFELRDIFRKRNARNGVALMFYGVKGIGNAILWPVFIFLALNDYLSLGVIVAVMSLLTAVFAIIIGIGSDKFGKKKIMIIGSVLDSITWPVRIFAQTFFHIFAISSLASIFHSILYVPFDALVYDKASRGKTMEFLVFREIMLKIGSVVFLLGLFLLSSNLVIGIAFCSIASLGHTLLK